MAAEERIGEARKKRRRRRKEGSVEADLLLISGFFVCFYGLCDGKGFSFRLTGRRRYL